jgi:uncharacterized membrane protein YqjE
MHLHKPLHQTRQLLGYFFFLLPLSFTTLLFLTLMNLNIISLDPNNTITKEKETTIKDPH